MNHLFPFLLLSFAFSLTAAAQDQWLRHPDLSPDGTQLAFSWQGDIWTVPAGGGRAHRLTVHQSYDSHPIWWPDGQSLVFTSNRFGNDDLFRYRVEDGSVDQLTCHSTDDEQPDVDPGGTVWFTTKRSYAQVEWDDELYRLDTGSATPYRAMDAFGRSPAAAPSGTWVAFVRGACRTTREAYTGPANRDIWLYDRTNDEYIEWIAWDSQEMQPEWAKGNLLYFLSAREGRYNLYRAEVDSSGSLVSGPDPLTSFEDEGIRDYSVSGDGKSIVFERKTALYHLDPATGRVDSLEIDVSGGYHFYPVEKKTYSSNARAFAPSPDEEYLALVIRGDLYITRNDKEEKHCRQLTDHPWRDQSVAWLNDSTLLFLSDRSGKEELYLLRSADPEQADIYKSLKHERIRLTDNQAIEQGFVLSHSRDRIAIVRDRGKLVVADIDEGGKVSNERMLLDGWARPRDIRWSPDDKWLAYAQSDLNFNREIYIYSLEEDAEPFNVSMHPRGDSEPVWSRDGTKLGFLSNRNNGDADVWFAWLTEKDWLRSKEDWEELEYEEEEKEPKDSGKVREVLIDPEGIHERLEQVTRMPGNERNLVIGPEGNTFYFTSAAGGEDPALYSVQWDGSELKELGDKAEYHGLTLDEKGKNAFALGRNGIPGLVDLKKGSFEARPFKAKAVIHHRAEREQVFEEAWSVLDLGFYDPDFHGKDWERLRAEYKDRCLSASTAQDFRDMFNEMLGQLNASHMGIYGRNPEELQKEQTGLLGIEGRPVEDGEGFEILRIVPKTPADRPESRLRSGEIIKSINGRQLKPEVNVYEALTGTVDEKIYMHVIDSAGEDREIVIRPTGSIRDALYEEWVADRKALTHRYSGERLGYIHIRGMNWSSFERFERELMASGHGKEGLVIDVRYNGGGWTTDMLMTVLSVRQHAYTIPRGAVDDLSAKHEEYRTYYPFGERLPLSAWTKPSIALCNENSYSNAEIFSHAYKTLDIGTLVGQPTFGAVISTGGHGLMDGSFVRMPFRAWYVKATDENMEHGPAIPDVPVEYPPGIKAEGEDPQLRKAVDILLEQIDEHSE